jgi:signal transduction histidine kinase
MALSIIGVSIIQVISLNNAYTIRKKKMVETVEQITGNIERDFEEYTTVDSIAVEKNMDSALIINTLDTNSFKKDIKINTEGWGDSPGDAIDKIHNAIDLIFNVVKISIREEIKINFDTLVFSLKEELTNNKITNYQYKIHYNDSIVKSNCTNFIENGNIISKRIGDKVLLKPLRIEINLTHLKTDVLVEMKWVLILPLLLLLITITSYFIIVKTIINQKKVNEIKNDFIDNITHELKTPISTISLAIEAMQSFNALDDPNKTKRYLDISKNANDRLTMLVDKILNITKYEQKNIELNKTNFNLIEVINEISDSISIKLIKKNGIINVNSKKNNQSIFADKEHITTVIYNIIDNAIKYSGDGLIIDLNILEEKGNLKITIIDNGIGIPNSHISKVFDKFHRVPNKDIHNIKGYGLGLSYVKSIIEMHEGTISLKSELKKGSTFSIKLPNYEQ